MTVKAAGALLVAIAPALMSVPVVGPAVGAVLSSEPAIVAFSGLMAVNAGASGYNAYQAARADDWQTFTSEAGNVVLSSVFAGGGFRALRAPRLPGLYTGEYTTSRYGDIRVKVPVRTPNPSLASKPYGGLTLKPVTETAATAGSSRRAPRGVDSPGTMRNANGRLIDARTKRFVSDPSRANNPSVSRPYIRQGVRDEVLARAPRDAQGRLLDPNTFEVIEGDYHLGHKPYHEWWRIRDRAISEGWTREQLIEYVNDPDLYQIELSANNLSHQFEAPR